MNLEDLFGVNAMHLSLEAHDKKAAIRELLAQLVTRGVFDEETLKKAERAVHKREAQASTGIGKGLGIPHAKGCAFVKGLVGVYGRSASGVPFESVDGEPVHVFFLVLSSAEGAESHLAVMRRIATLHRDEKSLRYLAKSTDAHSILGIFRETDEQFG